MREAQPAPKFHRSNETGRAADRRRLSAIDHVQRPEDRGDMRLHGLLGETEFEGDTLIGLALAQSPQDVDLTVGQRRPAGAHRGARIRQPDGGRLGVDQRRHIEIAVQDQPDGGEERVRTGGFGHVAERALGERFSRVPSVFRGGDHDDRQLRSGAAEFRERSQTVHSRHGDVEDDDVEIGMRRDERKRPPASPTCRTTVSGPICPSSAARPSRTIG